MPNICFVSVDVEGDFGKQDNFEGVEKLNLILDIFEKHNVSATLFVMGKVLQKYSLTAKQWSKSYEIACHSFSHTFWNELSGEQRKQELEQFKPLYQNIFGQPPKGFRAPSHLIDGPGLRLLQEQGFLYDSSIVPHYPFFKKYRGYQGKAPREPYYPADDNPRVKGALRILEIPLAGLAFGLPLAGAWIAKLPFFIYRALFEFNPPDFISLSCHSWDVLKPKFLDRLEKILDLLKNSHYQFYRGEEIAEKFQLNIR